MLFVEDARRDDSAAAGVSIGSVGRTAGALRGVSDAPATRGGGVFEPHALNSATKIDHKMKRVTVR